MKQCGIYALATEMSREPRTIKRKGYIKCFQLNLESAKATFVRVSNAKRAVYVRESAVLLWTAMVRP